MSEVVQISIFLYALISGFLVGMGVRRRPRDDSYTVPNKRFIEPMVRDLDNRKN